MEIQPIVKKSWHESEIGIGYCTRMKLGSRHWNEITGLISYAEVALVLCYSLKRIGQDSVATLAPFIEIDRH